MDSPRVRIVIADDDPVILREIATFLETRFAVVGRVTNGRELIETVEELAPALVVTDVSMPEMNGIEATLHIRRLYPHIPVIILSAHSDEIIRKAAPEVGA